MENEPNNPRKPEIILDLDPRTVQSNETLGWGDHVAIAMKSIRDTFATRVGHYLRKIEWQKSGNELWRCQKELDGFLLGIGNQKITVGQGRISELFHQLISLVPEHEIDLKNILTDCLSDCIAAGACTEGQHLGFSMAYRRQCQEAGITEPSADHAKRIR